MELGRLYFAIQATAGALWWVAVFLFEPVRTATLGGLDPVIVAILDVPLFVVASVLAALRIRAGVWITVGWTLLATAGVALYATVTGEAGWGAVLMVAASAGTVGAAFLVLRGRMPSEWIIVGPFRFRPAPRSTPGRYLAWTLGQLTVFWLVFLAVLPAAIVLFEQRWQVSFGFPLWLRGVGLVLFLLFSALGIWTAVAMAKIGEGTPLPIAMPTKLVTSGPYRFVRNPMALAGIGQGVAVGLAVGSWLVVVYAVAGSMVWNWLVRPHEEDNLAETFGADYVEYRSRVRCWVPSFRPAPQPSKT